MFKNYLMDSEEFGRLMNPYKSKIKKIVFEKSSYLKKDGYLRKIKKYLRYIGDSYMDISFKTNKSVWAYIDEENTLHIMSTRMLHATSVNRLFVDFENVESISFNNSFRTNEIKSFDEMFKNCKRLTYIDFSGIKTDNAESFCGMFVGCESIEEL